MNVKIIYKVECDTTDDNAIYNGYFQTKPFKVISKEFIENGNITVQDFLMQTCLKNYPGTLSVNGFCDELVINKVKLGELVVNSKKHNIFIVPIAKAGENYILSRAGVWEDIYLV